MAGLVNLNESSAVPAVSHGIGVELALTLDGAHDLIGTNSCNLTSNGDLTNDVFSRPLRNNDGIGLDKSRPFVVSRFRSFGIQWKCEEGEYNKEKNVFYTLVLEAKSGSLSLRMFRQVIRGACPFT